MSCYLFFSIFTTPSHAEIYRTQINKDLILDLENNKLTVQLGYQTNFIFRGVNPITSNEGDDFRLIKPSAKAIDFSEVINVDWDGYYPSIDFVSVEDSLRLKNYEKTDIFLDSYTLPDGGEWKNGDVLIRGASIIGLIENFPDNENEAIDAIVLTLLNPT